MAKFQSAINSDGKTWGVIYDGIRVSSLDLAWDADEECYLPAYPEAAKLFIEENFDSEGNDFASYTELSGIIRAASEGENL